MASPRKPGKLSPEALKTAVLEIISKHPDGITEPNLHRELPNVNAAEILVAINELVGKNRIEIKEPQGITTYQTKE